MANTSVDLAVKESLVDRFRRELRNPSMLTVGLIVLAVVAIPLAMLIPSWVSTTKSSLQAREKADALRDSTILSSSVLIPAQITPWMFAQIERMKGAESPFEWTYTSFTLGPCATSNLSQLPPGEHATAIGTACADLNQIQVEYAGDCPTAETCNIPDAALARLEGVRLRIVEVFSNSGFVIPYREEETGTSQ